MSMWGVFRSDSDDSYHVMPTDRGGQALNGHRCDVHCWCNPAVDAGEPSLLIHFDAPLSLH